MFNNKDRAYTNVGKTEGVSICLHMLDWSKGIKKGRYHLWVSFQNSVTGKRKLIKSGSLPYGIAMPSKNFFALCSPSNLMKVVLIAKL